MRQKEDDERERERRGAISAGTVGLGRDLGDDAEATMTLLGLPADEDNKVGRRESLLLLPNNREASYNPWAGPRLCPARPRGAPRGHHYRWGYRVIPPALL